MVIDTLRYDHVGANGNAAIRTPNMDRLASESWRFERCFANSFPTVPFRLDTMTARYGAPFHTWMPLPYDWPTLPEAFAQAGYATQLIHDTPHMVNGGHHFDWPFHGWTFARGAEVDRPWVTDALDWPCNWAHDPLFDFAPVDLRNHPGLATYMRANRDRRDRADWNAARLFGTAARFLHDNQKRNNFFLWIDCFDPHEPWDAPQEFVRMYDRRPGYDGRIDPRSFYLRNRPGGPPEVADHLRAQYAAKVTWMDHCMGEFLDVFEQTGLANRTALLLTADHGTRLGEFGIFGKGGRLPEQIGRVPLLVRPPGGERGVSKAIVQPQDVWRTLGALAGVAVPAECESQDLLAVARGGGAGARALAVTGVTADRWPARQRRAALLRVRAGLVPGAGRRPGAQPPVPLRRDRGPRRRAGRRGRRAAGRRHRGDRAAWHAPGAHRVAASRGRRRVPAGRALLPRLAEARRIPALLGAALHRRLRARATHS